MRSYKRDARDPSIIKKRISIPCAGHEIVFQSTKATKGDPMSKKKKSSCSIQIVRSSTPVQKSATVVDLDEFIKTSIEGTFVSKIDAIPTKENIVVDTTEVVPTHSMVYFMSPFRAMDFISREDEPGNKAYTLVVTIPKKRVADMRDASDTVDALAKYSTFNEIFTGAVEAEWLKYNADEKSPDTNVLFIPQVFVYKDRRGRVVPYPFKVNLCVLALPAKKYSSEGMEKVGREEYAKRVIDDVFETNIRAGNTRLIIDPYELPFFSKETNLGSELWHKAVESQRVHENITDCIFAVESHANFSAFTRKQDYVEVVF